MRTILHLAARLYPAYWRARYGTEFAALLDDARPRWRDVFDVLKGGLAMQLQNASVARMALVLGVLGVFVSTTVSLAIPEQFVSATVIRVVAPQSLVRGAEVEGEAATAAAELVQQVFSRELLARDIELLDLYPGDRGNVPMEDLISRMRADITISPVHRDSDANAPGGQALRVAFRYPDRFMAQKMTGVLSAQLLARNLNDCTKVMALAAQREGIPLSPSSIALIDSSAKRFDPPNLPEAPVGPHRWAIACAGLFGGALLGTCAGFLLRVRHTRITN